MPLDLPGTNSENNARPSSSSGSSSNVPRPPYLSARLADVFEMLRIAREARASSEQSADSFTTAFPDTQRSTVDNSSWLRNSRRTRIGQSESVREAHASDRDRVETRSGNGGSSQELTSTDNEPARLRAMFSQLSRHRGQLSSRSVGGDNLLQRELDGEDLPSRLSLSRVNALPRSNGMQWSFNSLAPPTIDNLGDNSSSRNHHRHSSMSTSPRVLEASASSVSPNQARGDRFPSLQDADMGQGSTIYKKLEDVLYFLDLQRLPPSSVSKPIRSVHFLQTFINATSWLRPGGVYLGVQSFEEEPTNSVSALTRQLRRTRFDRSHDWKVKVVIDEVNYTDMSIAGSMTAYDLPDAQERQSVTTFWTGELIDFVSHHSLLTKQWSSNPGNDVRYWRRLEPFREYDDESYGNSLQLC